MFSADPLAIILLISDYRKALKAMLAGLLTTAAATITVRTVQDKFWFKYISGPTLADLSASLISSLQNKSMIFYLSL